MSTGKHPILVALGERIRALRDSTGISQEKFAVEVGLDRSYYSAVERGERNISVLKLLMIANALKVDLAELFSNPTDQSESQ